MTLAVVALAMLPACSRSPFGPCPEPKPPPAGPFCTAEWCTVSGAQVNRSNELSGIAIASSDQTWAVGSTQFGTGRQPCPEGMADLHGSEALMERWDGRVWSSTPTGLPRQRPDAQVGGTRLTAVSASGDGDAWAVGTAGGSDLLLLRWDGSSWGSVPTPDLVAAFAAAGGQATGASLSDVLDLGPHDAWAVGSINESSNQEQGLLLHWNGRRWIRMSPALPSYPGTGPHLSGLTALAASGPNDVWAVGDLHTDRSGASILPSIPLALHFDGHTWTSVPTPTLPGALGNGAFADIVTVSPTDAWAAGERSGKRPGAFITLTEHWDGTAWSIMPSPNGGGGGSLATVTAAGRTIWAAGGAGDGPFVLRWDGVRWSSVDMPVFPDVSNGIAGLAADGGGQVWAVGSHGYYGVRTAAYLLRLRPSGGA
jgi:hypothetical protein